MEDFGFDSVTWPFVAKNTCFEVLLDTKSLEVFSRECIVPLPRRFLAENVSHKKDPQFRETPMNARQVQANVDGSGLLMSQGTGLSNAGFCWHLLAFVGKSS